jgi:signal transduction histidine kinase
VQQLQIQLHGILDAALSALGLPVGAPPQDLSAHIGEERAVAGIHPSQSLHAAGLLFEAALPFLAASLSRAGQPDSAVTAAVALNKAITARTSVAAEHYIGFLLGKLHSANADERLRISRELHDVVAPPLAVAIQALQLHDAYQERDRAHASEKLAVAARALRDAMATLRVMAAATRESLSRNGIEYAIRTVLSSNTADVPTSLTITGSTDSLPPAYAEELFLIVQEAIRNAFAHANPGEVTTTIDINPHEVTATVHDDGAGFDPKGTSSGDGIGLTSMRERAALLGGTVTITSKPAAGTSVHIRLPLPPHTTHRDQSTGTP